jgi:hypothetical protein
MEQQVLPVLLGQRVLQDLKVLPVQQERQEPMEKQ